MKYSYKHRHHLVESEIVPGGFNLCVKNTFGESLTSKFFDHPVVNKEQVKNVLLSRALPFILGLGSNLRKAIVAFIMTINDDGVTQYHLDRNYRIVKHKGRFRLYYFDKIAVDVSHLSELTSSMFRK